jgi:hypothetical protein
MNCPADVDELYWPGTPHNKGMMHLHRNSPLLTFRFFIRVLVLIELKRFDMKNESDMDRRRKTSPLRFRTAMTKLVVRMKMRLLHWIQFDV